VLLPFSHRQENYSFLQKNVSLILRLDPPTLSVNIIDFYVERVKNCEKLTKNFVCLCSFDSFRANCQASESRKACRIQSSRCVQFGTGI
jgi:hypothetical protein